MSKSARVRLPNCRVVGMRRQPRRRQWGKRVEAAAAGVAPVALGASAGTQLEQHGS